jgi:ubiquitin carboxyl-terminal hydrolase 7
MLFQQFHLKRFEYDAATDDLAKVNDRFEFPLKLDVAQFLPSSKSSSSSSVDETQYALR